MSGSYVLDAWSNHRLPARLKAKQAKSILEYFSYYLERQDKHLYDGRHIDLSCFASESEGVVRSPYLFFHHGFRLIFFPNGHFSSPSRYQLGDAVARLLKEYPISQASNFPLEPSRHKLFQWVVS